jgi:hypothetical protein
VIRLVDGLVRALVGPRLIGSAVGLPPDVQLRVSRIIPRLGGWLAGMGAPAAAVTLGRTILVPPGAKPDARLLRHELAHVRQWERSPVAFPFRYTVAHIRHGYRGNPYEIEARAAEGGGRPGEAP